MELRNVRSLVHLARTGSMSRAASELDLTPAAVHKHLKVLESELGIKLYHKVGGALGLTEQGKALLSDFRRLLEDERSLLERAQEARQLRSGMVRIGSGVSMSASLLPPLLRRFRRRYPGIELYVQAGNIPALLENLKRGMLDVVFIAVEEALGRSLTDLSVDARWKYEMVFLAPRKMAPRRCAMATLARQPFILYGNFRRLEEYFDTLGFRPRVTMRFDHADAMRAMAESGLGIALVPYWSIPRKAAAAAWVVEQDDPRFYIHVSMARLKQAHVPRAVQSFIDTAKEVGFPRARMLRG